ncbi:hypothetical protein D3C86_1759000 [compost metagenome]
MEFVIKILADRQIFGVMVIVKLNCRFRIFHIFVDNEEYVGGTVNHRNGWFAVCRDERIGSPICFRVFIFGILQRGEWHVMRTKEHADFSGYQRLRCLGPVLNGKLLVDISIFIHFRQFG